MTKPVQLEQVHAENRFPPYLRSLDWDERWRNYTSVLGDRRPIMAYVRDMETQRITPICKNLSG